MEESNAMYPKKIIWRLLLLILKDKIAGYAFRSSSSILSFFFFSCLLNVIEVAEIVLTSLTFKAVLKAFHVLLNII